jgi:hypothetical protein
MIGILGVNGVCILKYMIAGANLFTVMDPRLQDQLDILIKLFSKDVTITYINPSSIQRPAEIDEVVLEPYKLASCPDVTTLIQALTKKCTRVTILRSQRYALALCIALLCSRGYCITSMQTIDVPDTTIEVCWESLNNIYISVDEPLKSWLSSTLAGRTYIAYGLQFCQKKFLASALDSLTGKIKTDSAFKMVSKDEQIVPQVMWDRDDVVYSCLSSHFRHEAAEISGNTQ